MALLGVLLVLGAYPPGGIWTAAARGGELLKFPKIIKRLILRIISNPICIDTPYSLCYNVITNKPKEDISWLRTT